MSEQRRRGPMGGHGRMMSGEKAKDFKEPWSEFQPDHATDHYPAGI